MTRFSLPILGVLLLLAGTAQAQDDMMPGEMPPDAMPQGEMTDEAPVGAPTGMNEQEDPCTQQVTDTENALADRMQSGELSEEATNRVYELLDRADAECADGDVAAAEATLGEARATAQ
ncbi:MAG: hypothetical protein ACPW61_08655 [Methyloligella sp. ZOD6]